MLQPAFFPVTSAPGSRVRFGPDQIEGAVLCEYEDDGVTQRKNLSILNQPGRSYYRVGDLILTGTESRHHLEELYPEFRAAAADEPSALQSGSGIALAFLGWEVKRLVFLEDVALVPYAGRNLTWSGRGSTTGRGGVSRTISSP